MKAMVYRRYGGPEVLELAELPPPKTHVDSVLVRVRAAAVNPADLAMQAGALDGAVDTYFPVITGWDILPGYTWLGHRGRGGASRPCHTRVRPGR
jgi:NADPH:quinone reductase-like Zn-dependent oxidoreductase